MDYAAKGKAALEGRKYDEAIKLYTDALAISPTSPDYLIQRATAYHRAGKFQEALIDANNAVLAGQKRGKRELIIEGQLRRGCAYYSLEQFGNAEFCFGVVNRMNEKHKMIGVWKNKTAMALAKLEEGDQKSRCTIKETPEENEGTETHAPASLEMDEMAPTPLKTEVVQTSADKIRHEWYQNTDNVYFTLLAKGVPSDHTNVNIKERSLDITFPLVNGSSFDFTLDPLFGEVIPDKTIVRVLPTKVEIILTKATSGQKWASLESKERIVEVTTTQVRNEPRTATFCSDEPASSPYPTSSKQGAKNWDKITREANEEFLDPSKRGKSGADDDDDMEDGDEANYFFKKLFKDASPDVRRAMMKSYTESNGTALSTNWDEVQRSKVETLPPTGMEVKQWEK